MTLATGTYRVEWYSLNSRDTVGADQLTVGNPAAIAFTAPFAAAGPAVLYLKHARR